MSRLEPGATVSSGRYVVQRLMRQGTIKAVYLRIVDAAVGAGSRRLRPRPMVVGGAARGRSGA